MTEPVQLKVEKTFEKDKFFKERVITKPKNVIISNKTLGMIEKYQTYKLGSMSAHKLSKEKDRMKKHSFRTKTRSGNSLQCIMR